MKPKALLVFVLLLALGASAQTAATKKGAAKAAGTPASLRFTAPPKDAEGHEWWQHAVFYEIYPRSFGDTNNDGIGDLKGITRHLDYLKRVGVDAIWITPMFPSPQVDFGYDVSDYEDVNPDYGTLADMNDLTTQAKRRGIHILLDYVINHTSDKHKWFVESAGSKDNPKRDWYVWRDGKSAKQPPNNWMSLFGGPAWQLDPKTEQYYYHYFYVQQPDLNWRNPEVEKAMFDVTRFWYDRGVAGFRLDAVGTLYEDPQLRDNPVRPGETNALGDPIEDDIHNKKLPEVHAALQRLRKVADEYGSVLVGETWTAEVKELQEYYGPPGTPELQMPMDLQFASINVLSAPRFREHVANVEAANVWPTWVMSNHDIARMVDRYSKNGELGPKDQIAKLLAGFYLTLRGTPVMYYGEELGMENNDPKSKEEVLDLIGKLGWPKQKGRDGERTPMQWTSGKNAGFSMAKPWLPVPDSARTHNVAAEERDPKSVLTFYRNLLRLRRVNPALREGTYAGLSPDDSNVLSYLRQYKGQAVLVAVNMSDKPQKAKFDLSAQGHGEKPSFRPLLASAASSAAPGQVSLRPFGIFIGAVVKPGAQRRAAVPHDH